MWELARRLFDPSRRTPGDLIEQVWLMELM